MCVCVGVCTKSEWESVCVGVCVRSSGEVAGENLVRVLGVDRVGVGIHGTNHGIDSLYGKREGERSTLGLRGFSMDRE